MQEAWAQALDREHLLEKEQQPTPVFLPGKSHGQRSLVGSGVHGVAESDRTEHACTILVGVYSSDNGFNVSFPGVQ